MSTLITIIGAGVTWLIVAFVIAIALCRAAALGDAQIAAMREAVPPDVYDDIDFDALNRQVGEYRSVSREHGFDAALSRYAGEPLKTSSRDGGAA